MQESDFLLKKLKRVGWEVLKPTLPLGAFVWENNSIHTAIECCTLQFMILRMHAAVNVPVNATPTPLSI